MTRGPKNKQGCPSDIHLRLSEDIQEYIDSLGTQRYQEKIIEILKHEATKKQKVTSIEIQSKLVEIGKEQRRLTEIETEWLIRLRSILNDDAEFERIRDNIHNAVFPEKPI